LLCLQPEVRGKINAGTTNKLTAYRVKKIGISCSVRVATTLNIMYDHTTLNRLSMAGASATLLLAGLRIALDISRERIYPQGTNTRSVY